MRHERQWVFQMAEVVVLLKLFRSILLAVECLRKRLAKTLNRKETASRVLVVGSKR
jgi:hypothetical protein